MPRPRRKCTSRKQTSTMRIDDSANITVMDSKIIDDSNFKIEMWKALVKDKIRDAICKFNQKEKEGNDSLELHFHNLLMGMKKNALDVPVDINNKMFRTFILSAYEKENNPSEECQNVLVPIRTPQTVKRRSRSVSRIKHSMRSSRLRSISVDVYKTPTGRLRLSSIMSNKKYTVMKPPKAPDSGVSVKRVMKPDEVAISTCGSPLYVAPSNLGAPHVNIPLPGGVVLNIEPKETRGPLELPGLDAKTKQQLKILCEQLKNLI